MKDFLWRLIIATAVALPICYFIKENPFDTSSFLTLEEKELVSWQSARMQISPARTEHLRTFKHMQRNSEPLKNVNSQILIGAPPTEKKLLTIGISSARWPQGGSLLDTLESLFFASSSSERKHIIVLVHLGDPDHNWLRRMVSDISALFQSYIQARQLVVISTPRKSYFPLKNLKNNWNEPTAYAAFHSKQNMDYALLMSFAANHSDYFLMMDDHVKCAPGFVTQIVTIVSAWEYKFWVTLDFSHSGFTGKLFHTRDLPYLVRFLLLFHQQPCDYLLSYFRDLLQPKPIQFSPSLFQHTRNHSSFEGKFSTLNDKEFEENDIGSPSNPAATIFSSLDVTNSILGNAYSLDKKFLYVKEAKAGSHVTVILNKPATVFRVQVLTGCELNQKNHLKEGHVELGYDTANRISDCDEYVLLGLLVNGTLNQQVLSEEFSKKVRCVRLLITATLPTGLIVRHINLWIK